jgi:hypothetical protein
MIVQEVFGFVKRDGPEEVVRSEAEEVRRGLGVQGKGAAAPLPLPPRCRRDEWVSLIILPWTDWVRLGLLSPIWACVAELFVALTRTLLQEEPSMAARYPIWLLVGVPTAVFGLAVASTVVPQVVHAVFSEVVRAVVKGLVG